MSDPSFSDPGALLTVAEVAAWLRVHPKTVYGWAARNGLPALKIHGALRFKRSVLEAFVDGCLVRVEPPGVPTLPRQNPRHTDLHQVVARAKRLIRP